MKIKNIFNKPKIIGLIANTNTGKSNFLYYLIKELKEFKVNLVSFGLRHRVCPQIFSLQELEEIEDSVIIIDEFCELFDLDNRKCKKMIENTIRLVHHNNNILILCGLPENFKKFIAGKLDEVFFKKVNYDDLINGSKVKKIIQAYRGLESGSYVLSIGVDEVLHFNKNYEKLKIPYLKEFDTKINNKVLIEEKKKVKSK